MTNGNFKWKKKQTQTNWIKAETTIICQPKNGIAQMKSDSNNCSKYSWKIITITTTTKITEIVNCVCGGGDLATVSGSDNNNGALIYCPSVNNCNKMNSIELNEINWNRKSQLKWNSPIKNASKTFSKNATQRHIPRSNWRTPDRRRLCGKWQ